MTRGPRSDALRVKDILHALETLETHATRERASFDRDVVMRYFVLKQVEIIGEAASRLSADFRAAHSAIPWKSIIGMRHILVHDYFKIDWDAVWNVWAKDLAPLQEELRKS